MNEEYIIIDGIKIRRLVSGHGPPILLVHGLGEFLEIWISNIAGLSQKFTVYAMDLPGHGLSEKTREDYTLGFSVNFIAKFMKAAGLHKVNLVGHSLGGAICVGFAMNFPDKVDNLVLVSTGETTIFGEHFTGADIPGQQSYYRSWGEKTVLQSRYCPRRLV